MCVDRHGQTDRQRDTAHPDSHQTHSRYDWGDAPLWCALHIHRTWKHPEGWQTVCSVCITSAFGWSSQEIRSPLPMVLSLRCSGSAPYCRPGRMWSCSVRLNVLRLRRKPAFPASPEPWVSSASSSRSSDSVRRNKTLQVHSEVRNKMRTDMVSGALCCLKWRLDLLCIVTSFLRY